MEGTRTTLGDRKEGCSPAMSMLFVAPGAATLAGSQRLRRKQVRTMKRMRRFDCERRSLLRVCAKADGRWNGHEDPGAGAWNDAEDREEGDGGGGGDDLGGEEREDIWSDLLDGMKERIVSGMKDEIGWMPAEEEDTLDDEGGEETGLLNFFQGLPREAYERSMQYEEDEGEEEEEDDELEEKGLVDAADLFRDGGGKWERALEDKLRQLVGADSGDEPDTDDLEIEGEDYFHLSEDEIHFEVKLKSSAPPAAGLIGNEDGLDADDEDDEDDEEAEGEDPDDEEPEDVNRFMGKVYERILSGHSPGDSSSESTRSTPGADKLIPKKPKRANKIYEKIKMFSPNDSSRLTKRVSPDGMKAMKKSLSALLGILPEALFELTFRTDRDGLSQLLFAAEVTGYFLRVGEIKHAHETGEVGDLVEEHEKVRNLPDPSWPVRKDVTGHMSWWDPAKNEKADVSPALYIQRLEAEVDSLRQQYEAFKMHGGTEASGKLLEYASIAQQGPNASMNFSEISSEASDAMQTVVNNLLGHSGVHVQQSFSTEREYLSQLILWCLMGDLSKTKTMECIFRLVESEPLPVGNGDKGSCIASFDGD